ncbi:phosphoglycerate dehydrogenase [Candidatus Pacearchaeota archaeon]|nr:phosphoglycerate dehydrogenase [Candidatus Pacearchaeota archaeon]
MKKRVLVSSFYNRRAVTPALDRLGKKAEIIVCEEGRTLTEKELLEYLNGIDAVIAAEESYNLNILKSAPQLAMIARDGVGLDSIDIDVATNCGVIVNNAPVVHESVADLAMGLIITTVRKIRIGDIAMRAGKWTDRDTYLAPDVNNMTLGLLGFGNVARAVAKRANAFDMKIVAYDPYIDKSFAQKLNVNMVTFDELLVNADVISIHAPLTSETKHIINTKTISKMKDNSYIVNTARGDLIDESALTEALKKGKLSGAGLDVMCDEPSVADNPLFELGNVTFTPHIGSDTLGTFAKVYESAVDDILLFFNGKKPRHVVNPEVFKHKRFEGTQLQ